MQTTIHGSVAASKKLEGLRAGHGLVPALEHLDEHAHRLLLGRVALGLVEQVRVRVRVGVRVRVTVGLGLGLGLGLGVRG